MLRYLRRIISTEGRHVGSDRYMYGIPSSNSQIPGKAEVIFKRESCPNAVYTDEKP